MDRTAVERLVSRWTQDAIAAGRLEVFDELLTADVIDRTGPTPSRGVEPFKARTAAIRRAFDEIAIQVDDLVVCDAAIAWRWTLEGTHAGPFAGLESTGRRIALRGVNFQRVSSGDRVAEHWTLADIHGALQALRA